MDEVALVATDQQKFQKSIKGIKKLLKSGKIKPRTDQDAKRSKKLARGKPEKKPQKEKGLVYISHIPHGFYENEMTQYFRQFGVVTNVRVLRSPRTGRSKGAAFVEFLEPTVAQIVADTMNNYLMGKRLLKAVLIPPEKQKIALRKNWNTFENPSSEYRRQIKKHHNENGTEQDDIKLARKHIKNLLQTKRKLQEIGIDYSFFQPVDVPEELLPLLDSMPEKHLLQQTQENKQEKKAKTQEKKAQTQDKKTQIQEKKAQTQEKKPQTQVKKAQTQEKKAQTQEKKAQTQVKKASKEDRPVKDQIETKSFKAEGKNAKNKVPEIGKKSKRFDTPDFINLYPEETKKSKVTEGSDDSNDEFDSDEFEMTMESDEDDFGSDDEGSDNSDVDGSMSSEEDAPPVSSVKRKKANSSVPLMKKLPLPAKKKANKPEAVSSQNGGKRKVPHSIGPIKKQKMAGGPFKQSSFPRKQKNIKGNK